MLLIKIGGERMKKIIYIMIFGAAVLFAASCNKYVEPDKVDEGSGTLSVTIDQEGAAKATLGDADGVFRFSSGDAIKVHTASSGVFTGTTASTSNSGAFTMADGFPLNQGGVAGFPAGIVTNTTASSIEFMLPTEYNYSQVGSTDPDACLTPVPMVGKYSAPVSGNPQVTLKQAGSVVRFQLRNVKAGTLSFSFATDVTGIVTLDLSSGVPTGAAQGILAANLTGNAAQKGNTIRVTNVPGVPNEGPAIYITLPVPTGTAPTDVYIVNDPEDASTTRMATVGSGAALNRAAGYKIAARPAEPRVNPVFQVAADRYVVLASGNLMARVTGITNYTGTKNVIVASSIAEWRIGGYNEVIGVSAGTGNYEFHFGNTSAFTGEGKWLDLFSWQGNSVAPANRYHGLLSVDVQTTSEFRQEYFGSVAGEDLYENCWTFTSDQIGNGGEGYIWRPLTRAEWHYLLDERTTSAFGGADNARFARVKVGSNYGLLLFPNNIGDPGVWDNVTMGPAPVLINDKGPITWASSVTQYTNSQLTKMSDIGVVFMPVTGYRSDIENHAWISNSNIGGTESPNENGGSWSSSSYDGDVLKAYRMRFYYSGVNTCTTEGTDAKARQIGRAVRLCRDVDADGI